MRSHRTRRHDDEAFEAALAGRTDDPALAGLVAEVRQHAATSPIPVPGQALAAVLASGLTTDKGDLPATAASNVPGPAPQAAGLPKRRTRMPVPALLGAIAAKLSAAGLATKAGVALSAAAISASGAAAADVLPTPVQDGVAAAVETVTPFDLPDSADAVARDATGEDGSEPGVDGRAVAEQKKDEAEARRAARGGAEPADADNGNAGEGADFGGNTATDAKDGGVDGATTASTARETFQPSTPAAPAQSPAPAPAAEEQGAPEGTPSGQPESTPTAGSNPGSSARP